MSRADNEFPPRDDYPIIEGVEEFTPSLRDIGPLPGLLKDAQPLHRSIRRYTDLRALLDFGQGCSQMLEASGGRSRR